MLATGFLPWWSVRYAYSDATGSGHITETASAWEMSTLWSIALVLTATVAAGWAWWTAKRGRPPRWMLITALACTTVSVLLVVLARAVAWAPGSGTAEWVMSWSTGEDTLAQSWMVRDRLLTRADPDLTVDVTWGLWVGLAAIVLVAVLVLTQRGVRAAGARE